MAAPARHVPPKLPASILTKDLLHFFSIQLEPICYALFALALFLRVKRQPDRKIFVLLLYYLTSAIGMSYAGWLAYQYPEQGVSNNWIYNMLILPAVLAIGYYFYQSLPAKGARLLAISLGVLNIVYFTVRNIPYTRILVFDNMGYSLLSISVSLLCFMYFFHLLKNVNEYRLWANYDFWIVSSLLLYFLGGFFIFLFYNILENPSYEQRLLLTALWSVHNVLLFLSSLIMLVSSIWINSRNRS